MLEWICAFVLKCGNLVEWLCCQDDFGRGDRYTFCVYEVYFGSLRLNWRFNGNKLIVHFYKSKVTLEEYFFLLFPFLETTESSSCFSPFARFGGGGGHRYPKIRRSYYFMITFVLRYRHTLLKIRSEKDIFVIAKR